MSQTAKKIFLWLFISLISVSFIAYFGITGDPISNQGQEIATVNGVRIYNTRDSLLSDNYRSLYENYEMQSIKVTDQLSQYLYQQAFRQTILDQLIVEKAKENYFNVSERTLLQYVVEKYFDNKLEDFKDYQSKGQRMIQNQIEKKATHKILANSYRNLLFDSVPVSKKEIDTMVKIDALEKKVAIASLNWKERMEQEVSDARLKKYFQKNINRYQKKNPDQPTKDKSLILDLNDTPSPSPVTFQEVKKEVLSDFLLENENLLVEEVEELRKNIDFKFKALKEPTTDLFFKTGRSLGMKVTMGNFFRYQAPNIHELGDEENILINSTQLIKEVFLLDVKEVSDLREVEELFLIFFVTEEKTASSLGSDFIRKRYAEDIKSKTRIRLANAFYTSLYENAKIVINN